MATKGSSMRSPASQIKCRVRQPVFTASSFNVHFTFMPSSFRFHAIYSPCSIHIHAVLIPLSCHLQSVFIPCSLRFHAVFVPCSFHAPSMFSVYLFVDYPLLRTSAARGAARVYHRSSSSVHFKNVAYTARGVADQ